MPTRPIKIYDINTDDTLVLSDNAHTIAEQGDKIIWSIKIDSGVDKIIDIKRKEGSADIFSSPPARVGGSKNWAGTIDSKIVKKTLFTYYIKYTKKGVTGEFIHDPIIQVNSKKKSNAF